MEPTWLSLVPPFITIIVAFLTRRIIISLLAGIVSGTLNSNNWHIFDSLKRASIVIWEKLEISNLQSWETFNNSWNLFILFFCILLGTIIGMLYRTGGSSAYGRWAIKHIKSRRGAGLSTMLLGLIIFFDDYFNCLTVGAVMRPVTDQFKISRAKLAYIIDSTTAPVCILAPISTWVLEVVNQMRIAGIGSTYPGNPFGIFMKSIFLNTYAWLALFMVFIVCWLQRDFGPMKRAERRATIDNVLGAVEDDKNNKAAKAFKHDESKQAGMKDLSIPLFTFIGFCIFLIFKTGDAAFLGGKNSLLIALQNMHLAKTLFWGSLMGACFGSIYFLIRRLLNIKEIGTIFFHSTKVMFPVVMTLLLSWSFGTIISEDLKTGLYLSKALDQSFPLWMFPALIFFVSCLTSFSTGTSWGTFAIMIPITVPLAMTLAPELLVPMMGALLAGAIFGDHASPISDTTILSSVGAGCNHMDHVLTQAPYSCFVATICVITYGLTGYFISHGIFFVSALSLIVGITLVILFYYRFGLTLNKSNPVT